MMEVLPFELEVAASRVAFGPGGALAVGGASGDRGAVAVFDAGGERLFFARAHDRPAGYQGPGVVAVALSPSGDRVASGSWDQRTIVHELCSGRPLAELESPDPVIDLVWHGSTIVIFGRRTVVLWDEQLGANFKKRAELHGADARVLGEHGGVVFVNQGGSTLARFDITSGMVVDATFTGAGIAAMAPDGRYALAAEKAGTIAKVIVVHSDDGRRPVKVKVDAPPAALLFKNDGELIAALTDGSVVAIAPSGSIARRWAAAQELSFNVRDARSARDVRIAAADDGRIAIATGDGPPILIR